MLLIFRVDIPFYLIFNGFRQFDMFPTETTVFD